MFYLNKIFKIILLFNFQFIICSGGFDHGSVVGKGRLQLDCTINPLDIIEFGQTYFVISYGLEEKIDIHGYFSNTPHENQIYFGLMYQFFSDEHIDLSTAIGPRFILEKIDIFFPQLLYTIKLNKFNIGGSLVSVNDLTNNEFLGVAFDGAFFFPLKKINDSRTFIEEMEFAIGLFKNVSNVFYPTYSIDMKFKKF